MVFSSWLFIVYFLPFVITIYYLLPKQRNIVLLISSLCFYAFGEPIYIVLLLFSSTLDYLLSKKIEKSSKKRKYLIASIVLNIGLLSVFKYADFAVDVINSFGLNIRYFNISLPIGISFYTFQTLSYTIDVYRGQIKASDSYLDYMMYVSMFPQLIAGPIVRYTDIEKKIKKRIHSFDKFHQGLNRFIIGLSKKVLIADQMAMLFESLKATDLSFVGSWVMLFVYGIHIYFDFSGYSDMAIGLGKMFGFDFLENFNYPFISKSVSEFWQRWHISLGSWFKEYVYFPLGGSRSSKGTTIRNLLIVWSLTGLWHGASMNFVLWGLYFGVFIVVEKSLTIKNVPKLVKHLYLLVVVTFSWMLFAFTDISDWGLIIKSLLGMNGFITNVDIYYLSSFSFMLVIAIVFLVPLKIKLSERVKGILMIVLFIISLTFIVDSSFSPFIYFRF